MSPWTLAEKVTEHDPVRSWRCEQLYRAGYPAWDALVLSARADVDLHRAVDLLQSGCSAGTAVRILL